MHTAYSINDRAFVCTGEYFGRKPDGADIARVIDRYREALANPQNAHQDLLYQARNWREAGEPMQ